MGVMGVKQKIDGSQKARCRHLFTAKFGHFFRSHPLWRRRISGWLFKL